MAEATGDTLARQVSYIFGDMPGLVPPNVRVELKGDCVDAESIQGFITSVLDGHKPSPPQPEPGREGPLGAVSFLRDKAVGGLSFGGPGGLMVESGVEFCSVRADVGVSDGRWYYEVDLLTSGIMQLGWCTSSTPFTDDDGELFSQQVRETQIGSRPVVA